MKKLWFCRICHSAMPTSCTIIVAETSISLLISPFFFDHADRLRTGICSSHCVCITTPPKRSGVKQAFITLMDSAGREIVPNTEEMAGPCFTVSVAAKTQAPRQCLCVCVSPHDLSSRAASVQLDFSHVSSGHPSLASQVRKMQVEAVLAVSQGLSFRSQAVSFLTHSVS